MPEIGEEEFEDTFKPIGQIPLFEKAKTAYP